MLHRLCYRSLFFIFLSFLAVLLVLVRSWSTPKTSRRLTSKCTLYGQNEVCCRNHHSILYLSSSSSRQETNLFKDDNNSTDQEAKLWQEKAQQLRKEIEEFEQTKSKLEDEERKQLESKLQEKQKEIDQYTVTLPILKPDGTIVEEQIQFPPRLTLQEDVDGTTTGSFILVCEATLPIGILLGEHTTLEGMTEVDEVPIGSNGQLAGIQEGDLIRACTACKLEMEQPTWQLMAGGIGRPKTFRFIYSTDYKPFEQVMEAIGSNRLDPEQRPLLLVVERRKTE